MPTPTAATRRFIWLGEDGSERIVTYGQFYAWCAVLQRSEIAGRGESDGYHLYALTIEGVVAMLACARIGAIPLVVYAGLATRRCATASPTPRPRL